MVSLATQANVENQAVFRALLGDYLTEKDLASALGLTVRAIRYWRVKRIGPPWTKVGQKVFYRRDAFSHWLRAQEHQPVRSRLRVSSTP